MKAQKKPVIIDYFDYNEPDTDYPKIKEWVAGFGQNAKDHFFDDGISLKVRTLEGTSYEVTTNDVIIRGVKGEYYPCKKDIFDQTYEKL